MPAPIACKDCTTANLCALHDAAPEMLDALVEIAHCPANGNSEPDVMAKALEQIQGLADAAIAKATAKAIAKVTATNQPQKDEDDYRPKDVRGRILQVIKAHKEGEPEDMEAAVKSLYNLVTLEAPGKIFVPMTAQEAATFAIGRDFDRALGMVGRV